jgi:pilus assembly protein CpaC
MRNILFLCALALLVFSLAAGVSAAPSAAQVEASARVIHVATTSGQPVYQRMTLSLDKAAIVELDTEAHDVLVSNPDIVDAIVRSPRRIFLLATKSGQTNAFFFDGNGKQILSLDIRVEKDVADLGALMKANLPNSSIAVSAMNDNVVLSGQVSSALESTRAADLAASFTGDAKKVVNLLKVAGSEQVMLKVRIAEMDRNIAKQFGVDLSSTVKSAGVPMVVSTSNPYGLLGHALSDLSGAQIGQVCKVTPLSSPVEPELAATLPVPTIPGQYNNALGVSPGAINPTGTTFGFSPTNLCNAQPNNAQGVMKALEQVGLVHMLAEPNLIAVSGETGKFLAGGSFPVPSGRDAQGNVSVQFKDFGVGLSFTPVVLSPGRISIQVSTEVSELTNTGAYTLGGTTSTDSSGNTTSSGGLTIPALNVRRAETSVELPSGGSFAIAGLMQHITKQEIDGFPGMKDMPVLGALFRSRDFQNQETELVVVVSAYLVQPNSESAFAAPTDGFIAPTDPETLLLGRLNAVYKKNDSPIKPQASAPVGFVVR